MEFKACKKYARISATKVRPVVDLIRGMPVNEALEVLRYNRRRGARFVDRVVRSAMASASEDGGVDVDTLYASHITVVLDEEEAE